MSHRINQRDYKLVEGLDLNVLESNVNEHFKQGYVLEGSPAFLNGLYIQGMHRWPHHENPELVEDNPWEGVLADALESRGEEVGSMDPKDLCAFLEGLHRGFEKKWGGDIGTLADGNSWVIRDMVCQGDLRGRRPQAIVRLLSLIFSEGERLEREEDSDLGPEWAPGPSGVFEETGEEYTTTESINWMEGYIESLRPGPGWELVQTASAPGQSLTAKWRRNVTVEWCWRLDSLDRPEGQGWFVDEIKPRPGMVHLYKWVRRSTQVDGKTVYLNPGKGE